MRRLLAAVPLLLVTACSGSSAGPDAGPAPSESPATLPTVVSASSAPSPSTSPAASPAASRAGTPAAAGDVDGDGEPDVIHVSDGTLAVTLSGGGRRVTAQVDSGLGTSEPAAAAGSVDVDRDGRSEVFVRVSEGASTSTLRMFGFDGSALRPVDGEDAPLLLVVGGSVTHGDGFSCTEEGRLVVRSAASDDGTTFTVTTATYRLSGGRAVRVSRTSARATGMDDPRVRAAYQVDCGPIGEGE